MSKANHYRRSHESSFKKAVHALVFGLSAVMFLGASVATYQKLWGQTKIQPPSSAVAKAPVAHPPPAAEKALSPKEAAKGIKNPHLRAIVASLPDIPEDDLDKGAEAINVGKVDAAFFKQRAHQLETMIQAYIAAHPGEVRKVQERAKANYASAQKTGRWEMFKELCRVAGQPFARSMTIYVTESSSGTDMFAHGTKALGGMQFVPITMFRSFAALGADCAALLGKANAKKTGVSPALLEEVRKLSKIVYMNNGEPDYRLDAYQALLRKESGGKYVTQDLQESKDGKDVKGDAKKREIRAALVKEIQTRLLNLRLPEGETAAGADAPSVSLAFWDWQDKTGPGSYLAESEVGKAAKQAGKKIEDVLHGTINDLHQFGGRGGSNIVNEVFLDLEGKMTLFELLKQTYRKKIAANKLEAFCEKILFDNGIKDRNGRGDRTKTVLAFVLNIELRNRTMAAFFADPETFLQAEREAKAQKIKAAQNNKGPVRPAVPSASAREKEKSAQVRVVMGARPS